MKCLTLLLDIGLMYMLEVCTKLLYICMHIPFGVEFAVYVMFVNILGPHFDSECFVKIRRLQDMGVDEHQARVALSSYNWDLERATEQIFS